MMPLPGACPMMNMPGVPLRSHAMPMQPGHVVAKSAVQKKKKKGFEAAPCRAVPWSLLTEKTPSQSKACKNPSPSPLHKTKNRSKKGARQKKQTGFWKGERKTSSVR